MTLVLSEVAERAAEDVLSAVGQWRDPQILGYHDPAFQRLLGTFLGDSLHCLTAHRSGVLCGALPYRARRSRYGVVLNAFPFFGGNGLVTAREGERAVQIALLAAFRTRARANDIFSAVFYTPFSLDPALCIDALEPDDVVVKFTQVLDLKHEAAWPAKRRADIARAVKRGYVVRRGEPRDAAALADLYEANCRRTGTPAKPRAFVSGTLAFSERGPLRWLVVEREGHLCGGLLYGQGPVAGSYVLPCASAEERAHQLLALLLDAAVTRARDEGLRLWNFESSPAWNDSVFKYKERWGARAAPFAVAVLYGQSGKRPAPAQIAHARQECPFYFIAPVGQVSGTWPADVPLSPLSSSLSRHVGL